MRVNSLQFEMMPGVLNVSWHTKYSWQHAEQTFLGNCIKKSFKED